MKMKSLIRSFLLMVIMLLPMTAQALNGWYSDAGGGEYMADISVTQVGSAYSYSDLTGLDEETTMEEFRGFESEHDGQITTEYPTFFMKFRIHRDQPSGYGYQNNFTEIYVSTWSGTQKIAEWDRDASSWTQTDDTYGAINMSRQGDWICVRFAPNNNADNKVYALLVMTWTEYRHPSQSWRRYTIHAQYWKFIGMNNRSRAREAQVEWSAPGKVKLTADNSWLPSSIGNNVNNFNFTTNYVATVVADGNTYSSGSFTAVNRGSKSIELNVPIDNDFKVNVTRNTKTSFTFETGAYITQDINENAIQSASFSNTISNLAASHNQVEGTMYLDWESINSCDASEFQVYRTELDEFGNYVGNREFVGSTKDNNFTDNASRGLGIGKYYRYEVFQKQDSWADVTIPTNPDPLTVVHAAEKLANTVPVIPLHLVQDATVTENITMDWDFGNVPKSENDVTFKVHRIEPNGTITHNYMEVTVPRDAGKATFSDEKPASVCSNYGYFLQLDLADNKVHIYSDTVYAHVIGMSRVTELDVSKGTAGGDVVIKWKAQQIGTLSTLYDVQRRFIGSGEWLSIYQTEGTGSIYTYTDKTTEPGRYYEYRVIAYASDCDDEGHVISNAMSDVGFCRASGVVSGRVQFDTGTAVDDVRVILSRESDLASGQSAHSRSVLEAGNALTFTNLGDIVAQGRPFTLQFYLRPDRTIEEMTLMEFPSNIQLRYNSGNDMFDVTMGDIVVGAIPACEYSQLSVLRDIDKTSILIAGNQNAVYNESVTTQLAAPNGNSYDSDLLFYESGSPSFNGTDANNWVLFPDFRGNVDEIRLWNRVLTDEEILADADRIISGEAEGLKAYITFDEGLEEYAFDSSLTNGVPNGHHVTVGVNTRPSDVIPTEKQLSSYGITNDKGEYEIRGIPFTGSGTRYSVYPVKGIHSFSPTSRSAFIGGTSLTINNVDFTDVSSFKVSGTIRYSGTTIPVDSVSFYVDGTPCNKNDKLIYSDANGEYEISVPIGSHYIEARRNGHTFEGSGRYPAAEGETYEFLDDIHIDFYDNTLVTLAGRVTGGQTEGEKPLGYGVSENTIGQAVITLTPLDHPQRMLNAIQHVEGTTTEWIPNPDNVEVAGASTNINSTAYRAGGNVDDVKYIYITTDEETGEFSAKVPPIRYRIQSVEFPNNEELERDEVFMNIPAINLTNPNDTIIPDTIYTASHEALPLFKCNRKLMLTYRSNPVIDITQTGLPAGVFGTDTITVRDNGQDFKLPIYNYNETSGEVTYNYGYPIFQLGKTYNFKVRAYEPYRNYDKSTAGELYTDMLRDSVVTFGNALGEAALIVAQDGVVNGQEVKRGDMVRLDPEQVQLDSIGEGTYRWIAGIPSLTAPYTRTMNASMVINGRTKSWSSEGLAGIITGVVATGNNFITAGPSHVQMVLRDPPGDGSNATWETDSVTCDYTYTVQGMHQGAELGVDYRASFEFDVVTGSPFFSTITYHNVISDNQALWKYELDQSWDNHTSVTYTNTKSTSTSSDMDYVGRDGDVFIGYSTNYIIGAADKVGIFKQDDGSWGIGMQETMAMDEKFNTHFEYSQKYIETTLFDNIKRTRNTLLKHISSMSEIEDNPVRATYYTFLSEDDPKYGASNNDQTVWGNAAKDGFEGPSYYARFPQGYEGCDSVMWCNQIIKSWEKTLADNEEDKIKAFNDPNNYKIGNESFERGVTVNNSTGSSSTKVFNYTQFFSTGFAYKGKNGFLVNKMGAIIISNTDVGYHQTKYEVDETTTNKRFSYTLNDTQRGNAHTVDIFDSPKGWSPIFRTRGGQTRCPYEGETRTKYYNPGTLLDYATMKSDNPHISMPVRNFVDIPAGQEAQVQVVFTNESETHEALTSAVVYVDALSNPNGLQIYMDGEPLVNGVEMWIEYGVPLVKTLTIKQSDNSILDYNDIKLILANSCKPEVWVYEDVSFSAHFVPAAPDITLKLDKSILNQQAVLSGKQVVATISDINRLFNGLKGVRLKYRFAGDAQWVTAHEWLTDASYYTDGHETDVQSLFPTDNPNITYSLQLPDIDGLYMVAAESMCMFGNKEYVTMTPEYQVLRDTRGPKLLGQAYPNTGILTPTDDIRIKFNEAIRESYLTKEGNFFITGSLNDAQVSHDVSLQFNGVPVETDAYLPINNTSFAATVWIKRKSGGTIIEHGTEGNSLIVKLDESGHVTVDLAGETIESQEVVPADKWVFLAMNYVKGAAGFNNTLTMLMAEDANETMLFDEAIVPDYDANGQLTLGRDFTGMMHELVLWNKNCPVRTLLAQKDEVVAPYLPGLVGYWKMNEGHGTIVTDYARSRNIHLPTESWNVENTNLAAHLDGEQSIKIPMGTISPRTADSYVVETWFRGEKDKNARATLLSVTDCLSIGFDYDNSMILHLYSDTLSSLTGNGLPIVLSNVNYNDGNWHHLALNVRRGVSAVVYIDGKAVKTLAEQQLPAPAGDYLYVGSILKRNAQTLQLEESYHFTGDIDELRVWNAACDGTSVIANRYNQVDTADVAGLIAYFPMEHSVLDANGSIITEFSLDNKAPVGIRYGVTEALGDGVTQAVTAPALRTAPLKQNLDFDFTASSDEIYINLRTLPSRMQGNLLTFIVKNVRDMQDNLSEAITWSAVVDYNTLEWDEDALSIEKDRLSEAAVTATLHNKGRESERFAISGLPTWIVPSVSEGVLSINETVPVQFTVGADAPVGSHSVYAYAVNDDDISSPLLLNIHVSGNDPLWTVEPDEYESSMNLIGQIYFGDKICTNTNTKIAAFVDGECRGVASPKLVTSRDAYFVNLTIYGLEDITALQPVSFRIYDAEEGVVLSDVVTYLNDALLDLTYRPNDLIGDFDNPVKWMAGEQIEQLCDLKSGWNWISLYVEPDEGKADLENVFGHSKVFNTIKGKEGFAMNSGTKWTSEGLDTVAIGNLYKIKVKQDVNYNIVGHRINTQESFQTIYPGWNWIGPLSIYNLSLGEAFADLAPTRGDIIKSKSQVAFYDGYKWEGNLSAVIPGIGYYYKSYNPNAVSFRYPTVDDAYNFAPMRVMRMPSNSPFEPVDHHQFSDNMNVVARVMINEVQVDTLTVGAFIGEECRGVTTATEDGYYMFTIAGNADETGQQVTFATVIDGHIVSINEKLTWVSDMIYGDLDEPVVLTVGSSGVNELHAFEPNITITPTLVQDVVQVRSDAQLSEVTVYTVGGNIVARASQVGDNAVSISLNHVASGVYFVEAITNDGYRVVKQIIKQ